jgi:hypothetical protein
MQNGTELTDCKATRMPQMKCGSGLEREAIAVKEFGGVACCPEFGKTMVRSIREAAGDCEAVNDARKKTASAPLQNA